MESFVPPAPQEWTEPENFSVSQISYVWYTAISVMIAFAVAVPACYLTGFNDPKKMNPKLAARPFDVICWWLPQETRDKLAFHLGEEHVSNNALEWGVDSVRLATNFRGTGRNLSEFKLPYFEAH